MVKKTFDYKDAEEKFVNCIILYTGNGLSEVFYDEELTNQVPYDDYKDLFLVRAVIKNVDSGDLCMVISATNTNLFAYNYTGTKVISYGEAAPA